MNISLKQAAPFDGPKMFFNPYISYMKLKEQSANYSKIFWRQIILVSLHGIIMDGVILLHLEESFVCCYCRTTQGSVDFNNQEKR